MALVAIIVAQWDLYLAPTPIPDEDAPPLFFATQKGDDLRTLYLSFLGRARESINIYAYSFSDKQVAKLLRDKQRDGVEIKVFCDGAASPTIRHLLGSRITVKRIYGDGLMHLKVAIVDGTEVLLGSTNMTGDALTIQKNIAIAFKCRTVAEYLLKALERQLTRQPLYPRHEVWTNHGQSWELWLLPHNPLAIPRLLHLIDTAKKTIRVAMYTFTRYDLANALLRAQQRGVAVTVHLDAPQTQGANRLLAQYLLRSNIPLSVNRSSPIFHYKMMLIDDETFVCGSANWTKAAFTRNDDYFLVLSPLLPAQRDALQKLWMAIEADSERVMYKS